MVPQRAGQPLAWREMWRVVRLTIPVGGRDRNEGRAPCVGLRERPRGSQTGGGHDAGGRKGVHPDCERRIAYVAGDVRA